MTSISCGLKKVKPSTQISAPCKVVDWGILAANSAIKSSLSLARPFISS